MRGLALVTGIALAVATVEVVDGSTADAALRPQLERIANARVFFAHQSVGANLLDGLGRLAAEEGVQLHIDDMLVPENGDPMRKLRSFEEALDRRAGAVDVAMLKFCYVDLDEDTSAAALFESYRATIRRLQARYPGVVFVHVTVPLTVAQGGIKAMAKRLLGRHPYGTVENVRREEYNALLRAAYLGKEPFFDLARVESVGPDGATARISWQGRSAPALAPDYTDDGGHLNAAGRIHAARSLAAVLSGALANRATTLRAAAR